MSIIARNKELEQLNKTLISKSAEFLAIYGRRRVGKTYLISEYFKDKGIYFEMTGSYKATVKQQLTNFYEEYCDSFFINKSQEVPKTWQEAFTLLRKQVQQYGQEKKIILFFDELPWLASARSGFLSALEHCWNRYLSRSENVILIVCGSAASWMLRNIINNKGGLYGRLTGEIYLKPYTLKQTELFLQHKNIFLERKQIIELYLALGGIPKYLNYVTRGNSITEIIQSLCFTSNGPLTLEFNKLYRSLFDNSETHIIIIEALGHKSSGLTQAEIQKVTKLKSGGSFTRVINDLISSGFIALIPEYGNKKRDAKYRLIDEYSLFYINWIKPALEDQLRNISEQYWLQLKTSPSYYAWAGYAFEGICFKHTPEILNALKISVVAKSFSSWNYMPEKGSTATGAQIDMVIIRADKCINLIEIKFSDIKFNITKTYAENLRNKKEKFRELTKTKSSVFMTFLSTYGVLENGHYYASVDNQLTMDIFFE